VQFFMDIKQEAVLKNSSRAVVP